MIIKSLYEHSISYPYYGAKMEDTCMVVQISEEEDDIREKNCKFNR